MSAGSSPMDPIGSLVHTRNIVNPLAGAKLSGKIGSKNYISFLYAADRIPENDHVLYGNYSNSPVLRYKRSLREDSYLGVLVTSVINNSMNYVVGADYIESDNLNEMKRGFFAKISYLFRL